MDITPLLSLRAIRDVNNDDMNAMNAYHSNEREVKVYDIR